MTWLGVTSKHCSDRISRRLRLRSRLSARFLAVDRGGKTLFDEQVLEVLMEGRLVGLDRHQVVSSALKENELRCLFVGVQRVGEDDFLQQVLPAQKQACCRDLIA